ncbi:AIPR family protein [Priestia megaterium]|uniref:AIPR family protein n=1 Tax=Priestia megaterium TaxID=1404 RepID=UPI001C45A508|nr:AIPR family protein [Priestia megaterium]MBV6738297.1 AIPR family protein [Priestia megaterium]
MIKFESSIEDFITSYLEAKGYDNMEFEENKHLYYDKDDKNDNGLFIYDIYSENEKKSFDFLVNEVKKLKGIHFKEINFVIIVRSIRQKYALPNNEEFENALSIFKDELKNLLEEKQSRNIKISYKFIPITADLSTNNIKPFDIKIKDRYRATQANPLVNPKTNGLVFTANLFDIVKLYDRIGDSLFNDNLRIGLGDKQDFLEVAPEITKTLKNNPEEFWFLNNGITIIVDEQALDLSSNNFLRLYSDTVTVEDVEKKELKISVINGAQTISAAGKFFFEDAKIKDANAIHKIKNDYLVLQDDASLNDLVKALLIEDYPETSKILDIKLKIQLIEFFQKDEEKDIKNTKKFIEELLDEYAIKQNEELISEHFLKKLIPNQLNVDRAEKQADVLLRVIYYSNQDEAFKMTNKITVALNRQKPMRMEDIALASQFVQNINYYNGLDKENAFSIIRRGEPESSDFKRHSLETVTKMLMIIAEKNPGKLGSYKLSRQLEEQKRKDDLIIFKEDSVFHGIFNDKSILHLDENGETKTSIKDFENSFNARYSFINSAIKMNNNINNEYLKNLRRQIRSEGRKKTSNLGGLFEEEFKQSFNDNEVKALNAILTYGSDYILVCWFYKCCLFTLEALEDKKKFIDKIIEGHIDFNPINFSSLDMIFENEYKSNISKGIKEGKLKYKEEFYKFLVELANRWEVSEFVKDRNKDDKYNKNAFKSPTSHTLVNEFLTRDLYHFFKLGDYKPSDTSKQTGLENNA